MNPTQRSLSFSSDYYMKKIMEEEIEQFELPLDLEKKESVASEEIKLIEEKENEFNRK